MITTITVIAVAGASVATYYKYRDYQKHVTLVNNAAKKYYLSGAAGANKLVGYVKYGFDITGVSKISTDRTIWIKYFCKIYDYGVLSITSIKNMEYTVNTNEINKAINSITANIKNKAYPNSNEIMQHAFLLVKLSFMPTSAMKNILWNNTKYYGYQFYKSYVSPYENNSIKSIKEYLTEINLFTNIELGVDIYNNINDVQALCEIILSRYGSDIQEKMLSLLEYFSKDIISSAYEPLKQILPNKETLSILLNFMQLFLQFKVMIMEIEYQKKKIRTMKQENISEQEYDQNYNEFRNPSERIHHFMKIITTTFSENENHKKAFISEMSNYFWVWLKEQAIQSNTQNNN